MKNSTIATFNFFIGDHTAEIRRPKVWPNLNEIFHFRLSMTGPKFEIFILMSKSVYKMFSRAITMQKLVFERRFFEKNFFALSHGHLPLDFSKIFTICYQKSLYLAIG